LQVARRAITAESAKTSVRWKIFVTMLMLITINYVDRASLSVAMPLIADEFKLSPSMQGLVFSSFFWTYALLQIPGGMLADRFKPRIVIASSTVFWGTFQLLAAICSGGGSLILTRLALGAAEAPIYPAGGKLNGIWMTQHERGRGATLLDGGAPLGAALGSILVTWLIGVFKSWRSAFVIAGAGTVLAGAWAWRYVRNSPVEHPGVNEAEASYIEAAHRLEHGTEPSILTGRYLDFFKYRSVWAMCFGWMCFNSLFYGLLTWMPSYLNKVHSFDITSMGGASFIVFLSGFAGELAGGWVADRWSASGASPNRVMRTLFGFAAIVATASIFSVSYASNSFIVVALLSSTLFFLRWCGLYWSVPSMIGTRAKVGFLGGVMNLGGNIAGIGVPVIVGMIVQFTGSYFAALMFFASAGLGLLIGSLAVDYETKLPV
jgi:ACS family D-galactonate transporter-like MFS transporter